MSIEVEELSSVTPEMKVAGSEMGLDLYNASIAKTAGGRGGVMSWSDYLTVNTSTPNLDLIMAYINEEIDSVTAIYLAMKRAAPK